jgi:hypothetical protein
MNPVATFIALPGTDRLLLLRAVAALMLVRLGLRVLSVERLRAWAARRGSGRVPADRLAWAVRIARRRLPGTSCLAAALALQRMLSADGHESELHIGVARTGGDFAAHAWLTHDGEILVGEEEHEDYTRLVAWRAGPG